MTKKNLWLGILAIMLVLGMTVVGCGDGSTDGNGNNNNNGNNNGGSGNSSGGTFTLTDIPSTYNGKYACLVYPADEDALLGCQSIDMSTGIITSCMISNESVSMPMWAVVDNGVTVRKYSGNDTRHGICIFVYNTQTNDASSDDGFEAGSIAECDFDSVAFSNGSATRSWSQGSVQTQGNNNGNTGGGPPYNVENAWKWGEGVEFTVSGDTITVNVTKNTDMDSCGVQFSYNVEKNKTYRFSFEAWTKSGTRNVRVCFGEDTSSHYPNTPITMTSTKKTYNLDYLIGENWISYSLDFNCGGDIGELYIRIISIEPLP
jgi:hypothetical protein